MHSAQPDLILASSPPHLTSFYQKSLNPKWNHRETAVVSLWRVEAIIPLQLRDSRHAAAKPQLTENDSGNSRKDDSSETAEDVVILLLRLRLHDVNRLYRNVSVLFSGHVIPLL